MSGGKKTIFFQGKGDPPKKNIRKEYCKEWEIDQLLQFCMHNFIFWIFAWVCKAKYLTKISPTRRTNLLYIYPFQGGHILVK